MALTAQELNALPYNGSSPASKGLLGEDFRREMRNHGEKIRWFRAYKVAPGTALPSGETTNSQGLLFIEQTLNSAVRVQMYTNEKEVAAEGEDGQFVIAVGETMMAYMPDEIKAHRQDRILSVRPLVAQSEKIQSDGEMRHEYPSEILEIISLTSGVISSSTYSLNGRSIAWTGTPPTGDLLVTYEYVKAYEFTGHAEQGPVGMDGVRLPTHAALKELTAGEEANE